MPLTQGARQAYKLEQKLGWNTREPLVSLQDFADNLSSKYGTPPVTVSSSPNVRRAECLGVFKYPNKIILEPVTGQNKATVLHEFTHYLDFRDRKECPHDNKFRNRHRRLLKEMAASTNSRRSSGYNQQEDIKPERKTLLGMLLNKARRN